MDFGMFFKFPGILILAGVILLIIAIVIGFIAYRVPEDAENEDLSYAEDDIELDLDMSQAIIESDENTKDVLVKEEVKDIKEPIKEENVEEEVNHLVEESLDEEESLTLPEELDEEVKEEKPIVIEESKEEPIKEENVEDEVKEEEQRQIYGGYRPLDNVVLDFNEEKKALYGDETLTNLPLIDDEYLEKTKEEIRKNQTLEEAHSFETLDDEDEEIEML